MADGGQTTRANSPETALGEVWQAIGRSIVLLPPGRYSLLSLAISDSVLAWLLTGASSGQGLVAGTITSRRFALKRLR
jgi:hypothetical protein